MNFSTSLSETSANLPECSSNSEKGSIDVQIWQLIDNVTGYRTVFTPRSHFVNEISKEPAVLLNGKLSCNWLIILVTMSTPISSHVKDKNSIFTAGDEDTIFQ